MSRPTSYKCRSSNWMTGKKHSNDEHLKKRKIKKSKIKLGTGALEIRLRKNKWRVRKLKQLVQMQMKSHPWCTGWVSMKLALFWTTTNIPAWETPLTSKIFPRAASSFGIHRCLISKRKKTNWMFLSSNHSFCRITSCKKKEDCWATTVYQGETWSKWTSWRCP